MTTPILATKLHIPPPRPKAVLRPHLIERLNEGLHCRLTLISAPAGFGKTALLSEWVADCPRPIAWLSLDDGDSDPTRFLAYLIAALQTVAAGIGERALALLQSPQPPPTEWILTALLNEITAVPDDLVLVLDDYHVVDAKLVDDALAFLLEHLPAQMHLVIATREDPRLPLARLRVRGQLAELRANELRFSPTEAAAFLNQAMGLSLSREDIAVLEARTEGWIAGLQLAAILMQGQRNTTSIVRSFSGSHRFVLDYLVDEVLQRQPDGVRTFLLRTSILDRMCGPLCDAVLLDPTASGQRVLDYLERANLFVVPLDDERRWYRYHHLFSEMLRQRLSQSVASPAGSEREDVAEYHRRASQWFEDSGLHVEAFHHAAAANDVERAERLVEGDGIPRHFRGAVKAILDWLASLPTTVLDARPWLWWRYASLLLVSGQTTGVEEKLLAAEAALEDPAADDRTRNLVGRIAAARAVLALTRYQAEAMLAQSRRALEHLHPNNLALRANANWTLGYASFLQGDRAAAQDALTEAIVLSQAAGDTFTTILGTTGLGNVLEAENRLHLAAETYQRVLQLAGDQPLPIVYEAHLGLARVHYEWNDLDAAEQHGRQSLLLARQYDRAIDRFVVCEVFLARLKMARGDVAGAAAMLAQASQSVRQRGFVHRIPEVAAAQVLALIRHGHLAAATELVQTHQHPLSQARVHLARGDPSAALAVLEPWRQRVEAKGWQDERLKAMVLQAVVLHTRGERDRGLRVLGDTLALAEPGGFIRVFVDEGTPMALLLSQAAARQMMPDYVARLLAAFAAEEQKCEDQSHPSPEPRARHLVEPLSQRELAVLRLVAQGLSNGQIGERLGLALSTVKGHNRVIFDKLQVQRRTEAVARARELDLL